MVCDFHLRSASFAFFLLVIINTALPTPSSSSSHSNLHLPPRIRDSRALRLLIHCFAASNEFYLPPHAKVRIQALVLISPRIQPPFLHSLGRLIPSSTSTPHLAEQTLDSPHHTRSSRITHHTLVDHALHHILYSRLLAGPECHSFQCTTRRFGLSTIPTFP